MYAIFLITVYAEGRKKKECTYRDGKQCRLVITGDIYPLRNMTVMIKKLILFSDFPLCLFFILFCLSTENFFV